MTAYRRQINVVVERICSLGTEARRQFISALQAPGDYVHLTEYPSSLVQPDIDRLYAIYDTQSGKQSGKKII